MQDVQIVGVLNTTPDSYFDGGKYSAVGQAVKRAEEMIAEGVDIIEIGGQSTGPGSQDISVDEEYSRTIPVIQAVHEVQPDVRLSIDTYQSTLAQAALKAGVTMVNDVTAGRGNPDLFSVLASSEADLVLMYAKDNSPRTVVADTQYDDIIVTISVFLQERIDHAIRSGIDASRIIIDPGMGHFISSDPQYSFEVIARLQELTSLAPVFLSPSRKSFLAGVENLPPPDRLPGTIAASVCAVQNGARYIRTHDIATIRRALEVSTTVECSRLSQSHQ